MGSLRGPKKSVRTFFRRGEEDISSNLPLLQVDRSVHNNRWGDKAQEDGAGTASEGRNGNSHILTSRERQIGTRMNELSQLESPILRELARRIGEHLNVETPACFKTFKHPYAELHVGERWKDYQGSNAWKGLLEPDCDRVLKGEILRYGEFSQATYDAFDHDTFSKHCGSCKYTKADLLEQVGLENRGYEITNFLYATTNVSLGKYFLVRSGRGSGSGKEKRHDGESENSTERSDDGNDENCQHTNENREGGFPICKQCNQKNCKESNWMGFVAVCTSREEIERLGRRDIVVAWRGTVTTSEVFADFMDFAHPAVFGPDCTSSNEKVALGFAHLYKARNPKSGYNQTQSARDQVRQALKALIVKYKNYPEELSITMTGHSLGSALAMLCAYDIAVCEDNLLCGESTVTDEWNLTESRHDGHTGLTGYLDILSGKHGDGENRKHHGHDYTRIAKNLVGGKAHDQEFTKRFPTDRIPITVYSFGGPRVGNQAFVDKMEERGVAVFRVVNKFDRVTKLPGALIHHLEKRFQKVIEHTPFSYRHVGVCLKVNNTKSDYLKKDAGPLKAHNMEVYLHLVDSYQGINEQYIHHKKSIGERLHIVDKQNKYKPYRQTFRDFALVNKYTDLLRGTHMIPPCWWQEKNKGLVRDPSSGEWRFPHAFSDENETEDTTTPPKKLKTPA